MDMDVLIIIKCNFMLTVYQYKLIEIKDYHYNLKEGFICPLIIWCSIMIWPYCNSMVKITITPIEQNFVLKILS